MQKIRATCRSLMKLFIILSEYKFLIQQSYQLYNYSSLQILKELYQFSQRMSKQSRILESISDQQETGTYPCRQCQQSKKTIEDWKNNYDKLAQTNKRYQEMKTSLEHNVEALEKDLEEKNKYIKEVDSINKVVSNQEQQISKLTKKVEALDSQVTIQKSLNTSQKQEIDNLKQEIDNLKSQKMEKEENLDNLTKIIQDLQRQVEQYQITSKLGTEKDQTIKRLSGRLSELDALRMEKQELLKFKELKLQEIEKKMKAETGRLQKLNRGYEEQIRKLEQKIISMVGQGQVEKRQLEKVAKNYQERLKEQQRKFGIKEKKLREQLKDYEQQNQGLQQQRKNIASKISQLQEKLQKEQKLKKKIYSENQQLKLKIPRLEQMIEDYKKKYLDASSELCRQKSVDPEENREVIQSRGSMLKVYTSRLEQSQIMLEQYQVSMVSNHILDKGQVQQQQQREGRKLIAENRLEKIPLSDIILLMRGFFKYQTCQKGKYQSYCLIRNQLQKVLEKKI